MTTDRIQRFLIDGTDVRGEIVQLEQSYRDALAPRQDTPAVAALLGEFLAAVSLLGSTLKFEGSLILQASGNGSLGMLMAETTHDHHIRGIVRAQAATSDADFHSLIGDQGQLAITLDPLKGERYQSIVALDAPSLARNLDAYFQQSAQLPTRLWLAADGQRAAGLLLQALPAQTVTDAEERTVQWQHLTTLADTLKAEELLQLDADTLLYRLYHQESVRLLEQRPVRFRCSCSQERTERALLHLGEDELRSLLQEHGLVEVRCDFCQHLYRFSPVDIDRLFAAESAPSLH